MFNSVPHVSETSAKLQLVSFIKIIKIFLFIEINTIMTQLYICLLLARESSEECNFKQFVRTLAHFRPYDPSTDNPLNSREQKLKCKLTYHIRNHTLCEMAGTMLVSRVSVLFDI